jgi:hypothetical protein
MNKEIKLLIPDSLLASLEARAKRQGVSIEALCLSLLEQQPDLADPALYLSMANSELRNEIQKVLKSELPKEEVRKRVRTLESQITRFIR